jgi:Spy/CpxP family protein refolding chaperone
MRPRLPWVLFAVSLAVNIFFVAGVTYGVFTKERLERSPEARLDFIAERLNLDAAQRQGLVELRESLRSRWGDRREQRDDLRAAMLAELGKPTFDREAMLTLIDERHAQRRERIVESSEQVHAYLWTLDPPQREQFLALARERGFWHGLMGRKSRRD